MRSMQFEQLDDSGEKSQYHEGFSEPMNEPISVWSCKRVCIINFDYKS